MNTLRNSFLVAALFLFVGLAVAPSMAIAEELEDNTTQKTLNDMMIRMDCHAEFQYYPALPE